AQIIFERDGGDTAIGYLRDLLSENKDNPKLLGDIAMYYYKNGQIKEFELYKEKVRDLRKPDESFYRFLMDSSALDDKCGDVVKYGLSLLQINPGSLDTRMEVARNLVCQTNYQDALKMYESVRIRLPSYPKVSYNKAKLFLKTGNPDKALAAAAEEIKQNPTLSAGHYIRGEIYRVQKIYPKAIKSLEKAIQLDGKNTEALISLGGIKLRQGFHAQALEFFERAKKRQPGNSFIYKQLGFIYQAIGQAALAVENLKTYLELSPLAVDKKKVEALVRSLE
ncbi:MAG: tetratricopeptide repeat protein, partial [Halobacteriovoraceae bacterium]|nr:tetratricopeptide repeat protein [Halobacteriovoraceae bacterium]